MLKKDFPIALTFDIDWAPDFVIEECVEILNRFQVPATFFSTHKSSLMKEIEKIENFEVGIHPNFLLNTTHGSSPIEIMDTMITLVPKAQSMRTHGLFQTSNLFFMLLEFYPQIRYDFSLFLPDNEALRPFSFFSGKKYITRIPYQWEDDFYYMNSPSNWNRNFIFHNGNYQIFGFHPIHIYLNSSSPSLYDKMKQSLRKPLFEANQKNLEGFKNSLIGTRTWFIKILESIPRERFVLASRIPTLLGMK